MPDLGAESVRLRERNQLVWNDGQSPGSIPDGIESVHRQADAIIVEVGTGTYEFSLEFDADRE